MTKMSSNTQIGDKVKSDYLKYTEDSLFTKKSLTRKRNLSNDQAMTSAVTKMADALSSQKNASHGLEKWSVPTWDGVRKSCATWKHEFQYWMTKYKQDRDEQLQRLRKPLPKNLFWSDQVRLCKTVEQAWKIHDTEFGDQRKLMDTLLAEITNLNATFRLGRR